jgi:hypothetical protein
MLIEVTDIIATVAAAVAAVSAVASMVSAIASMRQVRLMREELDKRERPYIYGHFQDVNRGLIAFVLENKGSVAAINVNAHFEEPAPMRSDGVSLNTTSVFRNTIAFFPPGERYSVPIDLGKNLLAEGKPQEFTLNLIYQTPGGRVLSESIVFDIGYLASVLASPPTVVDMLGKLKDPLDRISRVTEWWRNDQLNTLEGLGAREDEDGR